jgi:hypothetical protein
VFVLAIVSITSIWNLRGEGQELLKANYRSVEYMQGMLSALDEMAERDSAERSMREMLLAQQGNVTERGEAAATRDLGAAVTEWLDRGGDPASTGRLRERIHAIIELNSSAISRRAAAAEKRGETRSVWIGPYGHLLRTHRLVAYSSASRTHRGTDTQIDRRASIVSPKATTDERVELRSRRTSSVTWRIGSTRWRLN